MTTIKAQEMSFSLRKRSDEYIKRTRYLVELAERELITSDEDIVSIEGLRKVRTKLDSIEPK